MKSSILLVTSLALAGVLMSGCATMHYPTGFKVEGKEVREFGELDDDRMIKAIVLIYNVKHDNWEDGIARSIALETYLTIAKKRNSAYIRNSGVLDLEYEKVKLRSWNDENLNRLFSSLEPKTRLFYMDSSAELTETQNANRVLYLTAANAVARELQNRQHTQDAMAIAGQVLAGLLTVALAML